MCCCLGLAGAYFQARKSVAAVWEKRKPEPELVRRKSHWDFVLEEMAWMANDFMQVSFAAPSKG